MALRKSLKKPRGAAALVEAALAEDRVLQGSLFGKVRYVEGQPLRASQRPKLAELLRRVAQEAPRLIVPEYVAALVWISTLPWVRDLHDWQPRGKGRDTLYRSLAGHLVASYPMPPLLWEALFSEDAGKLAPIVGHVAAGGSLLKAVQSGLMPVPLTRKMCHELLLTPGHRFMEAVRRVQIRAHDGDSMLLSAWMATDAGARLHDRETEEFWVTVLRWFCQNPMLDRHQVAPLLDYIGHRRREQRDFLMKGRSALALLRGMREWHGDLAKARAIAGKVFAPSGFTGGSYEQPVKRGDPVRRWRVSEVLTSKELAAEGRALKHCVYSYAWSIEQGSVSIWSMTLNNERQATVEVRNDTGRIVQARGKCNRALTAEEYRILVAWAHDARLEVSVGRL